MNVAVLVDLELNKDAGGHVKYWQRIGESFEQSVSGLKITIFFLGKKNETILQTKNLTFEIQKPILSSSILKSIGIDADNTDLFPFNPKIFLKLRKFDLIHTTDQFFSMAKTAKIASNFWKIPLTTSIHTDTPPYTKYYIEQIINKFFSKVKIIHSFLIKKLKIQDFFERRMFRKLEKYLSTTRHAMVADQIYSPQRLIKRTGNLNITKLNRGINKQIFKIKNKNKSKIFKKYNIPYKDKLLFFVGRIHELKGAVLLANVHRELNKKNNSVTTLMVGQDIHGKICLKASNGKLILLGYLDQKQISDLYNVCDLFVFPSKFEIGPNVVIEAKACGAICVVHSSGGGKRISKPGLDGIVIDNYLISFWVKVIDELLNNKKKINSMKKFISKQHVISWGEVFINDIFIHWKKIISKKE